MAFYAYKHIYLLRGSQIDLFWLVYRVYIIDSFDNQGVYKY